MSGFWSDGVILRDSNGEWHCGEGPFCFSESAPESEISFFVPDFRLSMPRPWATPAHYFRDLARIGLSKVPSVPELKWQAANEAEFFNVFADFKYEQKINHLIKAVPVVMDRAVGALSIEHIMFFVHQLMKAPKEYFPYAYWNKSEAVFGLSPELLFSFSGKQLKTMALAGTASTHTEASLLEDSKELHEHNLVVSDICEHLCGLGTIVGAHGTKERRFGSIRHLFTPIEVEAVEGFDFSDLIRRLHPTPALGGVPRDLAWAFLEKHTLMNQHRGRHGAPFGVNIPGEQALAIVAIRNVQWLNNEWRLVAGCGLVEQSVREKEWHELTLKREAVRKTLGLK